MARSMAMPSALSSTAAVVFEDRAASALHSSTIARSPLQLSAAEMFSSRAVSRVLPSIPQQTHRIPGLAVVNSISSPQGPNWLIDQIGSKFRHLQLVLLAARTTAPYGCQSRVGVASISKAFSFGSGGGGGGWGRGGGGGGGDAFGVPGAGEFSIGASADGEASALITEDVILLNVGGMSCGGCAASVKRILEAQPQVTEATVDLATETAVVQITSEPVAATGWEAIKRQLGESLAKHLTTCGFKSSLRELDGKGGEKPAEA